jgi:hypothetical protein
MSNKWKCNEKCYVPVGGILKLRLPDDTAEGEIEEKYQKYFDSINDDSKTITQTVDEYSAVKARLKELNVKFHPATGLKKLKKLLADTESGY